MATARRPSAMGSEGATSCARLPCAPANGGIRETAWDCHASIIPTAWWDGGGGGAGGWGVCARVTRLSW